MTPTMRDDSAGTARQLTATGRSAIAVIELTGDLSRLDLSTPLFRAANARSLTEQPLNALRFGVWGEPGEDVVLCRTAEQTIELTCHGGAAAVARILQDAAGRGFQTAPEAASRFPQFEALQQARTQRTAEILLEQASGLWNSYFAGLSDLSPVEAIPAIERALAWAEFGRHLVEPWSVVLCGRPNVGKSSLMNALAGFTRSIVSEQAGTTRDRVTLETAIDGWPVRITDTAGVRETHDPIEQEGVRHTLAAIEQADLTVIVLDASEPLQLEDHQLLSAATGRRLIVAHKADLARSLVASLPPNSLDVSSVNGLGVEDLLRAISTALVPVVPPAGQPVPVTRQQAEEVSTRHSQLIRQYGPRP